MFSYVNVYQRVNHSDLDACTADEETKKECTKIKRGPSKLRSQSLVPVALKSIEKVGTPIIVDL